jgi:crotonobetainyl-CoA:carnitine CoA-transferase CaiB-like acyl-CoA transferase
MSTNPPNPARSDLPLDGLRVLDFTRVLAGPIATMMLGDLGADVIKVERPGTGDDTRGWGPPFAEDGQAAYFRAVNRNKRSLAADLANPDDCALLRRLIAEADIVVDNFRPRVLARAGLDPRTALDAHPRLIWCTITGYGADSDRPGYDFAIQAEQGWMAITGDPEGAPIKHGVALADVIAGKDAAVAMLAALAARAVPRPAESRHLTISLAASAAAALVNVAQNVLVTGRDASRWGNAHANLVPYQCFDTADRPLVIAVGTDAQFAALADVLELPELRDPELRTNAERVRQRARVVGAIGTALRTRSAGEWQQRCDAAEIPCAQVRSVLDVVTSGGGDAVFGMPSAVGGSRRLPPPNLDADGESIRRAGGWSQS